MERRIDFWRERQMLCGRCDHRWRVDLDWIDRWKQAKETCPGCGIACEHEDSPRVTLANRAFADPADLISAVRRGLRQLQYRPDVLDGCLTGTGLRRQPP
ncbi:hypothetical protein [Streptomyces shenzhenensis]|uniref:hypothetical protein n=1 Tax=Streptomyces shenzhenensis TaxID=943815 RepID=UPI003F53F2CC